MKALSLVTTLLALGLIAPAHVAYAFDMNELIEAAKDGNGTYVETHSSASTGGQTARSGEQVITGEAHASSHTEINAGPDGGEVTVKIETRENGETTTKEFTQKIPKGEGVHVEATAESKDGETNAEVKVNGDAVEAEAKHTATTSVVGFFTETIPSFFKKVVGFFTGF